MPAIFSAFIFLASLPPFNLPLIGCFFLIPLLLHRNSRNQRYIYIDGFMFAIIISGYSFFGAWTYNIYAYLGMVFIFSLLFSLFLYSTFLLIRNNSFLAIVVTPFLWILIELGLESFNLPGTLAIPLTATSALLAPAQYGGQHLLSYLLIAFQLAIIVLIHRVQSRNSVAMPVYLLCAIIISFLLPAVSSNSRPLETESIAISIIQTNAHPRDTIAIASDQMLEDFIAQRSALIQNVIHSRHKPDLIIWPEVSLAKFEFRNNKNISQEAALYGMSMLVASPDKSPSGDTYNAIFSLSSTGKILKRYNKNIQIPFIEEESSGRENWIIHDKLPGRPGSIICYESIFSRPSAMLSAAGAGFISLATNDAYAGPSILSQLHLQFAKIRAVETGKFIIRAANAGLSAVISANGNILEELAMFKTGIINTHIQPDYKITFFVKHYHMILTSYWLLSSLSLIYFLAFYARDSWLHFPRQSITHVHIITSICMLSCALLYQYYNIRDLYQSNTRHSVPAGFVNFQNGLMTDTYSYAQLKVDTPEDSLLSAITYLLRDLGNAVKLADIRRLAVTIGKPHQHANIDSIINKFNFKPKAITFANTGIGKPVLVTPCLSMLSTGERIAIIEMTDKSVVFFSPYYGKILAIKTAAFMQKWTGNTIMLTTMNKPWDI